MVSVREHVCLCAFMCLRVVFSLLTSPWLVSRGEGMLGFAFYFRESLMNMCNSNAFTVDLYIFRYNLEVQVYTRE